MSIPDAVEGHQQQAGTSLKYFNIKAAVESVAPGMFRKMPYSSRVLAESILRKCGGDAKLPDYIKALACRNHEVDFPFYPARVVLQDLLGTPACGLIQGKLH